jgi:hypothetical protein
MADADRPFVAVIGGFFDLDPDTAAAAKAAGRVIGDELAKAGFGLVVYFSNEGSLEPHVVSGYCAALADGAGAIRVRYDRSQLGKVKFKEEHARPDLFDHGSFPGEDWEAPFYRSLTEEEGAEGVEGVDAVLLVAGATSVLIAGQIALARRLPILAVDAFGGSAAKIWNELAHRAKRQYSWGTRPAAAFVHQLKEECVAAAAARKEAHRREQILTSITSQQQKTAYAAGAFAVLLVTLFFGLVYTPFVSAYPFVMLAGLISAGATGALVRAVLWGPGENDPQASLLLGSVAGFVVGLAYLIPQWVGAPGVLSPKADTVSATDKIQFASAVLVAVSAGVGFDTVFTRLQKQAQDTAVGPPR